jgi:hypothetical protein
MRALSYQVIDVERGKAAAERAFLANISPANSSGCEEVR